MSSRREVFIRILALLQRKTLIETKNRTLKCLKRHYSTVRSVKNVAVLSSPPRGIWQLKSPHPGKLPSRAKKMIMPGGQPGGGGGWGLGAAGIDWCINATQFCCMTIAELSLFTSVTHMIIKFKNWTSHFPWLWLVSYSAVVWILLSLHRAGHLRHRS